jgi:hypothetical protein
MRERLFGGVASVLVIAAVLAPIASDRDDFPLSTYPMFSVQRSRSTVNVAHVVAWSREGRHRPVPPPLVGTREVLQAHETVRKAVRGGEAQSLCERAAQAVEAAGPEWDDVERLDVRTDHYDAIEYFEGNRTPRSTQHHASCEIDRGGA